MEIIELLKLVTLTIVIIGVLKWTALLFSKPTANLTSTLKLALKEPNKSATKGSKKPKSLSKEIRDTINSLNWITKLFQAGNQLLFELGPKHAWLLEDLDSCESNQKLEVYITRIINKQFISIFGCDSHLKIKALQAIDHFLSNTTAAFIIKTWYYRFRDLSSAITFLTVEKIKTIDKDKYSAKALISTHYYNLKVAPATVDSSIWFLLNQQTFWLGRCRSKFEIEYAITCISKCKIILRADVDLELLLNGIVNNCYYSGEKELFFNWYAYRVDRSPFQDGIKLYDDFYYSGFTGEALLLEDPKFAIQMLNMNFPIKYHGTRNYLLFFQENPSRHLARFRLKSINEMYSCFLLNLEISFVLHDLGFFRKLPKEKLFELSSHIDKIIKKGDEAYGLSTQLKLPYLSLVLLFGDKDNTLDINYARELAQLSKTFELLDVIKGAGIVISSFQGKPFNFYLLEHSNCDAAAVKHFHYYISSLAMGYKNKSLAEYLGINDRKVLSLLKNCKTCHVDCTLDRIPRQFNSYLEAIDRETQKEAIDSTEQFKIAFVSSMFNSKMAPAIDMKDLIHYMLQNEQYFTDPAFANFIRIEREYTDRRVYATIWAFLNFERLLHNSFSSLPLMDLERGFQILQTRNNFSAALEAFIKENFTDYSFPFVFTSLQNLEKELFNYNAEIAMELQIHKIPKLALLKAIHMTLANPSPNLIFAFARHLFNTRLLHKGLD